MILGSIIGIIAAIGYIGIGFTPWDKSDASMNAHIFFVFLAFPATLPVIFCYVTAFLRNNLFPKKLSVVYIILAIILSGYLYILFYGPSIETKFGNWIQVVGQKVIVYAEIIAFLIEDYLTAKLFQKTGFAGKKIKEF